MRKEEKEEKAVVFEKPKGYHVLKPFLYAKETSGSVPISEKLQYNKTLEMVTKCDIRKHTNVVRQEDRIELKKRKKISKFNNEIIVKSEDRYRYAN